MVKLKFPIKIKFEAKQLPNGLWELEYQEFYDPKDPETRKAMDFTVQATKKILKNTEVEAGDDFIKIKMQDKREKIFDFLAGEYLVQSSFAKLTFQDLFALSYFGLEKLEEIILKEGAKGQSEKA